MFGDMGVQGTGFYLTKKRGKRPGGDALAPVFPAKPVADLSFAKLIEANDVSGHKTVEDDGLLGYHFVDQDPGPMRHEGFSIPGVKGGHLGGLRVEMMLKEDGEVSCGHIP